MVGVTASVCRRGEGGEGGLHKDDQWDLSHPLRRPQSRRQQVHPLVVV